MQFVLNMYSLSNALYLPPILIRIWEIWKKIELSPFCNYSIIWVASLDQSMLKDVCNLNL